MNSKALWEYLPGRLEELACNVSQEFDRRAGTISYKYDIPISGHLLINVDEMDSSKYSLNRNVSSRQRNWFFFNNNFYNPSFIYSLNSSLQLTPVCRHITHKSYDPNMILGPISVLMDESNNVLKDLSDAVLSTSSKNSSNSFRLNKQQYLSMKRNEHNESMLLSDGNDKAIIKLNRIASESFVSSGQRRKTYFQIDLKDNFVLDHIGVMGGYPSHIKPFTREKANKESYCQLARKKRQKFRGRKAAFVYILDGEVSNLGFLKKYEVYYRHIVTNNWEKFPNSLDGNNIHNIFIESRSSVKILARYLRIIPLEYNVSPDFRINFYGNKFQPTEAEKAKYGITIDTGNTSPENSKDMIIRYIITSPQHSQLRNDGTVANSRDYYYNILNSKFKKKNYICRQIEKDQELYYHDLYYLD